VIKALPGHNARVDIFTSIRLDCTAGPLPGFRLAKPSAHCTVIIRRGTLKATTFKQYLATEKCQPSLRIEICRRIACARSRL
jgi:hypothetical protein